MYIDRLKLFSKEKPQRKHLTIKMKWTKKCKVNGNTFECIMYILETFKHNRGSAHSRLEMFIGCFAFLRGIHISLTRWKNRHFLTLQSIDIQRPIKAYNFLSYQRIRLNNIPIFVLLTFFPSLVRNVSIRISVQYVSMFVCLRWKCR